MALRKKKDCLGCVARLGDSGCYLNFKVALGKIEYQINGKHDWGSKPVPAGICPKPRTNKKYLELKGKD